MIEVTLACGHTMKVSGEDAPVCHCGERRVQRVKARAPKFRGVCQGPHASFTALSGIPVTIGAKTDG